MINSPGKKINKRRSPDIDRKLFHNRKENSSTKKKRSQQKQKERTDSCNSNHQRTIWDLWNDKGVKFRTSEPSEFSVRNSEPER